MALTFLSIGSNLGDRVFNLERALLAVESEFGHILSRSAIYESQSWGYEGQNFLNMVVHVETFKNPIEVLQAIRQIETSMGRIKTSGNYADRPIDLDILFYNHEIFKSEQLSIPHPHLQNRLFVLVPLMDIDPDFTHPLLGLTIRELTDICQDKGWIREFGEIK